MEYDSEKFQIGSGMFRDGSAVAVLCFRDVLIDSEPPQGFIGGR